MIQTLLKQAFKNTFFDEHGRLAIVAAPNLPLILWAAATLGGHFFWREAFSLIGLLAIVTWALLEIFQGVNYFRRALGVMVLAITLWSRVH